MLARRQFLGSILGMVAGQNFFVKTFEAPPQRVILPVKMFFRECNHDILIQAPGVQAIEKKDNGFKFIAEELAPTQSCCLKSTALYTLDDKFLWETRFNTHISLIPGDKLRCMSELVVSGRPINTLEEMIQAALDFNKLKGII